MAKIRTLVSFFGMDGVEQTLDASEHTIQEFQSDYDRYGAVTEILGYDREG